MKLIRRVELRRLPIGVAVLTVVMLSGCNRSAPPAASTDSGSAGDRLSAEASHEAMRELLERIGQQTPRQHSFIGSAEADDLQRSLRNNQLPPSLRWVQNFKLGQHQLRLGNEQEAIRRLLECSQTVESAVLPAKRADAQLKLMFELGVAYMRWGETQNCCLRNHPDSCILPIRGQGVHTNREGSESAVKCFTYICENTSPESDDHLQARWLLNIAWMTLGEYPEAVPKRFRIPPQAFESSEPLTRFVNIAQRLGIDTFSMCGGAIVDDFNGDQYLDLITGSWDPNGQIRLFRNRQDGSFADVTEDSGLDGFCGGLNMVQADYDNDGDVDFLVLRGAWLGEQGRHPNSLMRNDGNGRFTDVTLAAGFDTHYPTQTAAWADYDNDGDLDLYVGNETDPRIESPCQLYRNEGDGTFVDVAEQAGVTNLRFTKGVVWGDFNEDRFPDLFVSNQGEANRLYRNNRDGTFTDIAAEAGVDRPQQSFPAWFWDYDNDGHLDLYVAVYAADTADMAAYHLGLESDAERSRLFRGDGKGSFVDVTDAVELNRPDASMGANFGDINNDGFLDFYLGTGYPRYESLMPSVMYLNRDGNRFVDVTTAGGFGNLQKGHAVAFADLDNDGDQDVFEQMGGAFPGDRFHDAFYENPGNEHHWISLQLRGTRSNRSAIGARICVAVQDGDSTRRIYRHVNSGGSFGASPLRQSIGLGKATTIRSIEVFWPTTGETQVFTDVPVDQHLQLTEGEDQLKQTSIQAVKLGRND